MAEAASDTRESLLDAAERLFSARGYGSVGIREIAEAAEANLSSIKYHFGSKRELYLETVRRVMMRHRGSSPWDLLGEAPGDDLEAAVCLTRFVRGYLTALLAEGSPQSCGALMLSEAVQPSEAIDVVVHDHIRPGHDALTALVRRLLPPGDLPRAGLFARSILGQVLHYRVFRPFIELLDESAGADADAITEHVMRFTLRAMQRDDRFIDRVLRAEDAPRRETVPAAGSEEMPR